MMHVTVMAVRPSYRPGDTSRDNYLPVWEISVNLALIEWIRNIGTYEFSTNWDPKKPDGAGPFCAASMTSGTVIYINATKEELVKRGT